MLAGLPTRPLRGLVAALVVLGHASMPFLPAVGAPAPALWQVLLDLLGEVLTTLRMPAFFILSGTVAVHALAAQPASRFLRDRLIRLGVPLLTVLLLVNPIEVALRISHGTLLGRWQAVPLAAAPIPVPAPGTGMQHLWYLSTLLVLAAFAPGLVAGVRRLLARAGAGRATLAVVLVVVAPIAGVLLERVGWRIAPWLGPVVRWGIVEPSQVAHFAGFFVTGIVLAVDDTPLRQLLARRRAAWGIVVLGLVAMHVLDPRGSTIERLPREVIAVAVALPAFALALAGAARARHSSALLGRYAAASYTIYLLHHVVVVAATVLVVPLLGATPTAFVLVLIAGLAVPLLAHERIVDGSPIARFLLNGERLRPAAEVAPAGA